jgi:hypothetical protein
MNKTQAKLRSTIDGVLLRFFKAHPELSTCAANAQLIEQKADELLLDLTDPQSPEICLLALGNSLVRAVVPAAQPPSRTVADEPVPSQTDNETPSKSWGKERLRKFIRDNTGPVAGSREQITAARELPEGFTRAVLANRKFPKEQLDELKAIYGVQAVLDRLDGKS